MLDAINTTFAEPPAFLRLHLYKTCEKRQAPAQTVEQFIPYFYATKAAKYSETLAQMIVDFRLIFAIDCLTLMCQKGTVQTVTIQIFIVIPFGESPFITFFGSTTSSGGNGGSNTNSTTSQIPPTSTVGNQPQQLSSTTSNGGNVSSTQGVSNAPSFTSKTMSRTQGHSGGTKTPERPATRSSSVTISQMASLFSVLISTIMSPTGETTQRQPTAFSSVKTPAFTKERPQTQKTGINTKTNETTTQAISSTTSSATSILAISVAGPMTSPVATTMKSLVPTSVGSSMTSSAGTSAATSAASSRTNSAATIVASSLTSSAATAVASSMKSPLASSITSSLASSAETEVASTRTISLSSSAATAVASSRTSSLQAQLRP
ncbi:unnamed protein product [Didymodactylos carnosus]|uniref:Uncharacterized protein n=1 Tax=Didymodactylos carnosus TaxID=1234261 RepID=A0A814UE33_9BILA|nr:unnamed protein product [Didymodactylos carnosus]CAF3934806.1 unnamed protein product [Didymodactylos carnosus]